MYFINTNLYSIHVSTVIHTAEPTTLYIHAFQLCLAACTSYPHTLHSQSKLVISLCISVFFQARQSLVQQCSSTYFLPLVDSLHCWSPSRHCLSGSCSYLEATYNLCWCSGILWLSCVDLSWGLRFWGNVNLVNPMYHKSRILIYQPGMCSVPSWSYNCTLWKILSVCICVSQALYPDYSYRGQYHIGMSGSGTMVTIATRPWLWVAIATGVAGKY